MIEYDMPSSKRLDLVRQLYGEIAGVQELIQSLEGAPLARRISLSQVYAHAVGPEDPDKSEIDAAIQGDPRLRKLYRQFLERTARYSIPELRAASTGSDVPREGDGCRIRFQRSRAAPNQYYVIVELSDEREEAPETLIICDIEARCEKVSLPRARGGVAQIIVDEDAPLLRMLRDPKTVIFLK